MDRQIAIGRVEFGVVVAGFADAALQIVGHQHGRDPTEEFQRSDVAPYPVRQGLTPCGIAVGVIRSPEDGNEDGRLANFASHRVRDRHGRPGVIDKQLLARGICRGAP